MAITIIKIVNRDRGTIIAHYIISNNNWYPQTRAQLTEVSVLIPFLLEDKNYCECEIPTCVFGRQSHCGCLNESDFRFYLESHCGWLMQQCTCFKCRVRSPNFLRPEWTMMIRPLHPLEWKLSILSISLMSGQGHHIKKDTPQLLMEFMTGEKEVDKAFEFFFKGSSRQSPARQSHNLHRCPPTPPSPLTT